ncbi:MAG: DEAD/DEAH box helicase [Treponemataceae bacterium]|nr:DEAD/DEAH box helicase [Treponemataceae bacterium]
MDETISFEDLGLDEQILKAVAAKGFETPSPIQILAIPRLLEGDSNMIAKARTGTGKTAAFGLPLAQKIREDKGCPQALILTPTRELCMQVCREIESFTDGENAIPRLTAVYGGAAYGAQLKDLRRGVEIVVGTPGRVKDHLERGTLRLENISYFILDEADEMLDMGFIDDIETIFEQANKDCRILLFSATMPPEILNIAGKFMGDYEIIEEEAKPEEPLLTEQHYWMVREYEKIEALVRLIDMSPDFYGIIFTQTKNDADTISKQLDEKGYDVAALHGDIPQGQREKILDRFRRKKTRILVATDVAARGIDVEGLTHVVNYALPYDGPTYVHRIGRTGRAGAKGLAYTLVRPEERRKLDYIKNVAKKSTKGDLQEDTIPTVDEVLAVKRARIFTELQNKLIPQVVESEPAECPEDAAEELTDAAAQTDDGQNDSAPAERRPLPPIRQEFADFAHELCQKEDPEALVGRLLQLSAGSALDRKRYGSIAPLKVFNQGKQIRLYVQLGRRDGYNPKSIAQFFSMLCHIPGRMVDRIDMAENFCLVSLPVKEGTAILERSKKDKSLPHMHVDSKEGGEGGRRGGGSFGGRRNERRDFNRDGERPDRRDFGDRRDRGPREDRKGSVRYNGGRTPAKAGTRSERRDVSQRAGNASLYKKSK